MAKKREVTSAKRLAAEGGIASEERAAVELEIEANEGPVEEPRKKPAERAAVRGESGETGCPIRMGTSGHKCGRKFHIAPDGVDKRPVCLMHSKDPGKQSDPLFNAFWIEFHRTLNDAGEGEAHFEHFVFPLLDYHGIKFRAICRFDFATFTQSALFFNSTFMNSASFHFANFMEYASFGGSTFVQDANFLHATFAHDADFWRATFAQNSYFCEATFAHNAEFSEATFTKDADLSDATFTRKARFMATEFHGTANWKGSRFLDQAEFRRAKFEPTNEGEPSAVFALANFSKPGEIVFDDVDLSRALFHNCDVSQLSFTSSVKWAKRPNNRGFAVFDETIPTKTLERQFEVEPKSNWHRDHHAVEQIYQQLKKNYDSRLDYWTANEFHFGEMEMKRLAVPTDGPLLWLRRWWHPRLSFVALYRWASDYGNSYGWPLFWLFAVLLTAALLFPITGLELKQAISASSARVTYSSVWNRQDSWTNNFWTEAKLIGKSGITAIDTATFQRTPEYTPVYPRGRVVAIFETLLTSSLFALFLLAIRRQFRR